jgi:hypothetical protein
MPILPKLNCSLLVRTDFSSDDAWQQVADEATRENADGFRAYAEPVSNPAFEAASWETVRAAVPANRDGAAVLFVVDTVSLGSPDHPILVVGLWDSLLYEAPFRCIPAELWCVDNNLNIANCDWEDFTRAVDEDGVFRGRFG